MEIKVGDKVRVSKDAQKIFMYVLNPLWFTEESTVVGTHPDGVLIKLDANNHLTTGLSIPTKYLTKVEDEAKAKYKVGDKVRVLGHALLEGGVFTITLVEHREKRGWMYRINTHTWYPESDLEPYTEPTAPKIEVGDVIDTPKGKGSVRISYGDYWVVQLDNGEWYIHMETNMPYASYTEPKEQTEAEMKPNVSSIKIPIEVDLTDSYWDAYAAHLAKEIALKVANKYSDPKEAAEYAVSGAKAVVENLKKKRYEQEA